MCALLIVSYSMGVRRPSRLLASPVDPARRACSSVCRAVAGPPGDQVVGQQQDGCPGDGGEPGGQVEESLQGVDVEELGGDPAAAQRPGDADQAGQDQAL
jgi:hypothetical protein